MFWVISVYFNIRNTLSKSGTFILGHPVYHYAAVESRSQESSVPKDDDNDVINM